MRRISHSPGRGRDQSSPEIESGKPHNGAAAEIDQKKASNRPSDKGTLEDLRAEVFSRRWWHRIDLGNGIVTPGLDDSPYKLSQLAMPSGWTDGP
jgi:hypothetical protein